MGDEAMRRFMKGDGDDYWDHPDGRQVEYIRQAAVLRARLPHLLDLRSEATRFKKRKICFAPWPSRPSANFCPASRREAGMGSWCPKPRPRRLSRSSTKRSMLLLPIPTWRNA